MNITKINPRGSIAAILAVLAIASVAGCMFALTKIEIPLDNKDLFNMGFGAMIGWGTMGFHYFLGSSKGSKEKDQFLAAEMARDGK